MTIFITLAPGRTVTNTPAYNIMEVITTVISLLVQALILIQQSAIFTFYRGLFWIFLMQTM
jgi:hypothetical protein